MKVFALFAVALFAAVALADGDFDESDVIVLDNSNFDSVIAENEYILVEFYAPWCGHCKRLAPEYAKAATALKGEVPLAKVDADSERDLGTRFGVRGFPTLKFFVNGEPRDYEGGRTEPEIIQWLKKKTGPPAATLEDDAAVEALEGQGEAAVVGFFTSKDSAAYASFIEVAKQGEFDRLTFGEKFGADADSVRVTRNFNLFGDDKQVSLTALDSSDAIATFVRESTIPLVDVISQESYQRSIATPLPVVLVFDSEDSSDLQDTVVPKLAKEFKGKAIFLQGTKSAHGSFVGRMGASGEVFPTAVTFAIEPENDNQRGSFPFDEAVEFNEDSLRKHTQEAIDGTLKKWLKSEAVPESNDGPVKVVVASQFEELVTKSGKDVFVKFYAPWCGHCKKMAPDYETLGEGFSSTETLTIAKIDATANGVESKYGVRGFPTLIFFPAGDADNFIRYEGDRSLDDMVSFIKKTAKNEVGEFTPPADEE